jgi:hypothetical protein
MKLPEQEDNESDLLAEIEAIETEPDELVQPTEQQGGAVAPEAQAVLVDTFLNRIFQPGELLPWKKCTFVVVGVRGGIVALALKSVPQPPRARGNKGVRPSRSKRYKKKNHRQLTQRTKSGYIKPFVKNPDGLLRDLKAARKAEKEQDAPTE